MVSCTPGQLLAKAPGLFAGVTAPPTLTSPTRCRYVALSQRFNLQHYPQDKNLKMVYTIQNFDAFYD